MTKTLLLLLGLLLAISAACGGDNSSEGTRTAQPTGDAHPPTATGPASTASPELQSYFAALAELAATLDSESAPIFTTLSATTDVDEAKDAFGQFPDVLASFIDGFKALDPPDEVAAEHAASVSAGESFLEDVRTLNAEAQDETVLFYFAEAVYKATTGQPSAEFAASCVALQTVANERHIAVDLGCGGS